MEASLTLAEGHTYEASGLKTSFHGLVYQLKILMLYAKRANDKGMEFLLATEAESAEKFDDVVFTWKEQGKWSGRYIQVKHRLDPTTNKIKFKDLMTRKDTDFSLVKYFTSYCKVNQIGNINNMGSKEFIVCTNTDVDLSSSKFTDIFIAKDIDQNDILRMSIGSIQKINSESYEFIQELKNNIKEALCCKISSNKKIKELLKDSVETQTFLNSECNKIAISRSGKNGTTHPVIDWEKVKDIIEGVLKKLECTPTSNNNSDLKEIKSLLMEILIITNDFETVISNFISSLTLMTGLPGEEKLGELIKEELGDKYNLIDVDLLNSSFEKEMLDWLKCYDHEKKQAPFFTDSDGNKLFEKLQKKLKNLMTSGLSTAYPEKLKTKVGLTFLKRFDELSNFFSSEKQIMILIGSPILGSMKVLQTLDEKKSARDSYIFMRLRTLISVKNLRKLIVDTFYCDNTHDLLILECQNKERNTIEEVVLKEDILKNLLNNKKKRIVIITEGEGVFETCFKESSCGVEVIYIKDSFKDLAEESQIKILNKPIKFQGKDGVSLGTIMDIEMANEIIDQEILSAIIKEENIEIGNVSAFTSVGYEESYYIPRTFSYQRISKRILDDIQTKQLDSVIVYRPVRNQDSVSLEEACNFENCVVISNEAQPETRSTFDRLVEKYPYKSIHLLELRSNRLAWMASKGDVSFLQPYVSNNNQDEGFRDNITEEYFVQPEQLDHNIMILANDPGMGKSTVLSSLAKKIQEKTNEILWIVRIDLNDYSSHGSHCTLDHVNFHETDTAKSIDFITELILPEGLPVARSPLIDLQRKLFKATLEKSNYDLTNKKIRAVIMFDGFDEISPSYKSNTTTLIKALKGSSVAQLWITTRINEKCHLEKRFESPALVLNPFTFNDQSQFLSGMLKWNLMFYKDPKSQVLSNRSIDDSLAMLTALKSHSYTFNKIVNQIDSILNTRYDYYQDSKIESFKNSVLSLDFSEYNEALLKTWRYSIGDSNREFTCIPLHLRMLAEVTIEKEFKLLDNLPLFDLYGEFIKVKGTIFNREKAKSTSGNIAQTTKDTSFLKRLEKIYCELALQVIFKVNEISSFPGQDEMLDFEEEMEECGKKGKQEISRAGLVKFSSDGSPLFIHRSFAEYFLSEYLIRHIKNKDVQKLLLEQILFNDKYALVQEFVNGRLNKGPLPNATTRIKFKDSPVLKDVFLKMSRKGHSSIIKFLMDHAEGQYKIHNSYEFLVTAEDHNGNTALQLSIIWGHTEAMEVFLNWVKKYVKDSKNINILKNMLSARNHHTVFYMAILLKQVEVLNTFIECLPIIKSEDAAACLEELLLDEIKSDSTTFHAAAHSSSINIMSAYLDCVDYIVNINNNASTIKELLLTTDKERKTALHLAVMYGNRDTIDYLLNWIDLKIQSHFFPESVLTQLLIATDISRATALHYAAKNGLEENIESFLNWISRYYFKKFECSERNDLPTLKKLILALDKKSETILHWAAKNDKVNENSLEASLGFCPKQEDFLSIGRSSYSLLLNGKDNISNWISSNIKEHSNPQYESGNHPLAMEKRRSTILQNVAENGCSLNVVALLKDNVNLNKRSACHKSTKSIETLKTNSQSGKSVIVILNWVKDIINKFNLDSYILNQLIFATDFEGATSLHTAAKCGNSNYIKNLLNWILSNNADGSFKGIIIKDLIMTSDISGSTALHKAVKEDNVEYIETLLEWVRENENDSDNIECEEPVALSLVLRADSLGATPFHWATKNKSISSLNAILKGVKPYLSSSVSKTLILSRDNKGATALHWAAREGNCTNINNLLISLKHFLEPNIYKSIIIDLILAKDKKGATAFHWAAAVGDSEAVKVILSWVKSNISLDDNRHLFLKNLVLAEDSDKTTALHWAVSKGNKETIETMLGLLSMYINDGTIDSSLIKDLISSKDALGSSILHWTVLCGSRRSIESLLNWLENNLKDSSFLEILGEDLLLSTNYEEESALHWSAICGNHEFVKFLLDWVKCNITSGILTNDVLPRLILAKDQTEATYLHCAAVCGKHKCIDTFLTWIKESISDDYLPRHVLEELVLAKNNVGSTALHCAAINGCNETIETLLNCVKNNIRLGLVDPHVLKNLLLATDRKGETVLHWAVLGEIAAYRLDGNPKNGEFVKAFMHWVKRNVIDANLPYTILNDLVLVTSQHGETALRLFGNGSKIQTCPPWDWIRENLHEDTVDILGQMFILPD